MRTLASLAVVTALCLAAVPASALAKNDSAASSAATSAASRVKDQQSVTNGSVTVEGQRIDYKAVAGTIVLYGKGDHEHTPTVSMFYVAYFKKGAAASKRPITFLYNGGPGSASVWLHMGAFGPRRVVTADHTHTPPAPYRLVNNDYSLLDASDLVFIDAPATGFSRLIAQAKDPAKRAELLKKRGKKFFSVDGDGQAFAQFITRFLSRYGRWNSPKYLFGESYGTTRSAVLANILENDDSVDLNGVMLLSQILSFDNSPDGPQRNPGVDQAYFLALPTYAATAWYHHKLPTQPADFKAFIAKVEQFALGPYAEALRAGANLDAARKQAIAEQLHQFTGLPTAYWAKADLRVSGPMFEHELLGASNDTTGRLDTRFMGPSMDPMSKNAQYDPQGSAISSAYVSTFNDYVRKNLKFGQDMRYRLFAGFNHWDFSHNGSQRSLNVMPDLADAMKADPNLKVMVNGGYFDLATPFFAAEYELSHLPIQQRLHKNISMHLYRSGHMVYAHLPSLKKLHDNVVKFIHATDHGG